MIRFITIDLVVLTSALCSIGYYLNRAKNARRRISQIEAFFTSGIGGVGPIDGEHRWIYPGNTYICRDGEIPALYKHTGMNIYEYSGPVSERDR